MSKPDLAQTWRQRLDDIANSGRSVVDWCYFNQVSVHQYYYWKRRLTAEPPQSTNQQEWVPVKIVESAPIPNVSTGVTVRIAGTAIELTPGFDPATLRAVVMALSGLPC
jgi:hypothetical protein